MSRPHCQCTDGRCVRQVPQPVGDPDAITIHGSVGAGGLNRRDDATVIQQALNQVEPGQGGPDPKLKVDGWPWSKTIAAIRTFQRANLGWADGRVDPGGPTLAKLNTLVTIKSVLSAIAPLLGVGAAPSVAVDPKTIDELYSVGFLGYKVRLNKYAGSALKFFSPSAGATLTTYVLLTLLGYLAYLDWQRNVTAP